MDATRVKPTSIIDENNYHFGYLHGRSPQLRQVYRLIERVAPTDATVLIQGESGTGKELIAQTIHDLSARRDSVFLAVNCGALSPTLIETELFGHEQGSFTGATRQHKGYFERATGGTLFLDEVTELPPELQARLLRVLEAGRLTRVGGHHEFSVDVRIIAATNRDPDEVVARGLLRQDLYYRLSAFPIAVPPLRQRSDDIELLADHFLATLNDANGTEKYFSADALALLREYVWPGNVRELKNCVQRAYILADEAIERDHFDLSRDSLADARDLNFCPGTTIESVERRLILATLAHFHGDKRRAADALGVSLKTIYNRLKRYGDS